MTARSTRLARAATKAIEAKAFASFTTPKVSRNFSTQNGVTIRNADAVKSALPTKPIRVKCEEREKEPGHREHGGDGRVVDGFVATRAAAHFEGERKVATVRRSKSSMISRARWAR
jgi:hypothetical protein